MKLKKVMQLLLALVMVFGMAACAPKESAETPNVKNTEENKEASNVENTENNVVSITFTDREGIETVLDKVPERVVSISPAITETLVAVAGIDVLVGRTEFCDYPAEVLAVDEVGGLYDPNVEKIISLNPDVVLLSAHTNPSVPESLRLAGVKVIRVYDEGDFEGGYKMVEAIGQIMDKNEEAAAIVAEMQAKVAEVEAKIQDLPAKTVYYMSSAGEHGDFAATGDTYIHAMLERAGGINVAQDGVAWAFSLEALIEADPEVIISSEMSGYAAMLPEMEGYKDLLAVKSGNVIEIDTNPIDRIGVRFADGFEALARAIHPEAFQ